MGLFKKLKKAVGKIAKVGVAAALGAPTGGVLGAVAPVLLSKIKTAGANQKKLALAKTALTAKQKDLDRRAPGAALITSTTQKVAPPPKPKAPASVITLKGSAAQLVSGVRAKEDLDARAKANTRARVAAAGVVDKNVAKLTAGQKDVLFQEFKASYPKGTTSQFRTWLQGRI